MGSSMGTDVGRIMLRIASAVDRGQSATVGTAAGEAKKAHLAKLRSVVPDLNMSGVGRTGGRVNVNYKLRSGRTGPSALLRATGPVHLVERDTAGRVIRSRHQGRGSARVRRGFIGPTSGSGGGRRAVLNIPGIGFRRSARHPGTRGQEPWAKGRKDAEPKIRRAMSKETTSIIRKAAKP